MSMPKCPNCGKSDFVSKINTAEKAGTVGGAGIGAATALGTTGTGAAIGTALCPGIGTAVGAGIGLLAGMATGAAAGNKVGSMIDDSLGRYHCNKCDTDFSHHN